MASTSSHFVKSGFQTDELGFLCKPLVQDALTAGDIDGITVRVDATESIAQVAPKLIDFANSLQCSVVASIKLNGIATERSDDRDNVLRKSPTRCSFSTLSPRIRYVFDISWMLIAVITRARHSLIASSTQGQQPGRLPP